MAEELGRWLEDNRLLLVAAVVALFALVVLQRTLGGVRRRIRRRQARLHPKLHKYAGRSEADIQADRRAAARIIATSSTGLIAGYEIVRQTEAVFVEGLRSQEEAVAALKAAAARHGANAIINLAQQHTAAGRCTAQGDAVLIRPTGAEREPTRPSKR